ncbi:ParB/RepB/Spo0J family partition protein [Flavobacteriaceae bacterium]|nr:ParB/RepB/Spo0J family partition protein [Flavobacteriaceae bacterium]
MKNKKLGMGLSGLIGGKKTNEQKANIENRSFGMAIRSDIHHVPLGNIITNPNQPRRYFDDKAIKSLSSSISKKGVMQPILIKINKEQNKYEIISGERRFIASKMAGLSTIPAILKRVDELESFELSIIENIQRENLSVIEEAFSYQKLIDKFNYNHEEIADKIGCSRSRVSNVIRLLKLPKDVQELINKNLISYGHARAILNTKNQEEIIKLILENSLSVRDVEGLVRQKNNPLKSSKKSSNIILKKEVKDFFKSYNISCNATEKNGKGKFVLSYKNKSDLDDFISRIIQS